MPWYLWLGVVLAVVAAVSAASIVAVRSTERCRRFLHLSLRGKLRCVRGLLRDPEVPWPAKAVIWVVVGYLVSPLDLIPDVIPVLGQLDDVAVIIGAVALLLWLVPRECFEAALEQAEQQEPAAQRPEDTVRA